MAELEYAQTNDYLPSFLAVADKITNALGGKNGGEFKAWLRHDIGGLDAQLGSDGKGLIGAIGELDIPIFTTNYDTLIERALGRQSVTWLDPSAIQLIIRGTTTDVYHIHGVWDHSESVVFGALSYGSLLASSPAKAAEQIVAGGSSLLFIGCGAGLADPNFSALRDWLLDTFPSAETRHYRLCLDHELEALAKEHSAERIIPVPYGDSYDQLTAFLKDLAPPTAASLTSIAGPQIAQDRTIQRRAIEAIEARVRSETIVAEYLSNVDILALNDILIPPVLLPVPQEQFARSVTLEAEIRPQRCDPAKDARDCSRILIAGEETVGLTSALEWLIAEASAAKDELTPIIVDFRHLGSGHRPLERQIRKELKLAGIDLHPNEPLPKLALALDNVSVRPEKIFNHTLNELKQSALEFVVIGCRRGTEAAVSGAFSEGGINAALRYIGRLILRTRRSSPRWLIRSRLISLGTRQSTSRRMSICRVPRS